MLNLQDYGAGGGGAPDAHASTHALAGSDPLTLDASQVTGIGGADPYLHNPQFWQAISGSGVAATLGITISTTSGTNTTVTDATGSYRQAATAATTNAVGGLTVSGTNPGTEQLRNLAAMNYVFKTGPSLAECRVWVGFGDNASNAIAGSDTPWSLPKACVALRYSTAVDGTAFFRFVTSIGDGVATDQTETITTVAAAVDTRYKVRIVPTAGSIACYVNGALVATHTTNLPVFTTAYGHFMTITTLENVAKTILNSKIQLEYAV